jgi:hypothetical protein
MATSFTVPYIDRQPMSPHGKNSGEITCPSTAMTSLPSDGSGGKAGDHHRLASSAKGSETELV